MTGQSEIEGAPRVVRAFVVGHPIAHSRSPLIHNYWLAERKSPGTYEKIDVTPADFPTFLATLQAAGFAGGNVTIPHKEEAFRLVDRLTPQAAKIGAVNTVFFDEEERLCGDNTDASGFVAHLQQSLGAQDWTGRTALILGAGGASRAIIAGLADSGMAGILVANRTQARAEELAALDPSRVTAIPWGGLAQTLGQVDLLVNTTSLGMIGHPPLDIDLSHLKSGAGVADIVYAPLETRLLADARLRGFATVDGLGMLLHQAVPGFARWFGVEPVVTQALRDLIVADLARR